MRTWQQLCVITLVLILWGGAIIAAPGSIEPVACQSLSERECLDSTRCDLVLVAAHGKYECRESADRCAVGFRQGGEGAIKKQCESQAGCKLVPASCFCPPDLECACGGGPPAQCVEGTPSLRQ